MDRGYNNLVSYNTYLKVSGDTITIKKYDNTQIKGYQKKSDTDSKYIPIQFYSPTIYQYIYNNISRLENSLKINKVNQIKIEPSIYIKWFLDSDPLQRDYIKELKEKEEKRKERFNKSLQRAKSKIYDYVACNVGKWTSYNCKKEYTKFLTLTFEENIKDITKARKELSKFFKRLSYKMYKNRNNVFKYIAIPELQERGSWHFHIILFNMPYIEHKKILHAWGIGGVWINAIKTNDINLVASYVTKYITKSIELEEGDTKQKFDSETDNKKLNNYDNYKRFGMMNKKRYYVTEGLHKPIEIYTLMSEEEKEIIDNKVIDFIKKYEDKKTKEVKKNYKRFEYNNEYRGNLLIEKMRLKETGIINLKNYFATLEKSTIKRFKKENEISWRKYDKVWYNRINYLSHFGKKERQTEKEKMDKLHKKMLRRGIA